MAAAGQQPAPARQQDRAFEIFVKRAISSIHKESYGRTREAKELKDSCQQFLTLLEQHESGAAVYEGNLAHAVLQTLMIACASTNPKVVQLALGAVHKLIAYAWLQGESSTSEDLIDDDSDIVTRIIKQVIKCVEINNPTVQLSVVQALLTFTTAEHFLAHGDSLMSAVRAVFNLALGSESEDVKRVACNALLQILNTVTKRVTTYNHLLSIPSMAPSRRESEHESLSGLGRRDSDGAPAARTSEGSRPESSGQTPALPTRTSTGVGSQLTPASLPAAADAASAAGEDDAGADARTAQLAQLAEQQDIRGLEAAIGASAVDLESQGVAGGGASGGLGAEPSLARDTSLGQVSMAASSRMDSASSVPTPGPARQPRGSAVPSEPPARLTIAERDVLLVLTAFCKLASREAGVTEVESYLHQGKLLALELLVKVLQNPQHRWDNVRDAFTRHLRQPLCTTLLRNWATSDPASFQLAVKLLLSIMMQPKLRCGLKAELGAFYPLFVLVPLEHGCGNAGAAASGAAVGGGGDGGKLLEPTDLHTLYIVLSNLKQLCSDPQLLVDMFVNYDCDANAPALFERTMRVLGLIALRTDISEKDKAASAGQPAAKQQAEALARLAAVRDAAQQCIAATLQSLNAWAGPLREQQLQHLALQAEANGHPNSDGVESSVDSESGPGSVSTGGAGAETGSEAERLEAAWAHKSSLAKGIAMFNRNGVKGVKYLVEQNLVAKIPQSVARFLREHASEVDRVALGEYLGHHDPFAISVMHAFIDTERYKNTTIDLALRRLLRQFWLPGEAQKIDRIMEKFAERYFLDNPGQFRNADGPYMLSFAIIMLNTDAHNPLAERRLGKPEFVMMCHQPLSEEEGGGMAPVLPPPQLEAIFDRIVSEEIVMTDPDNKARSGSSNANKPQQNGAAARGPGRPGTAWSRMNLTSALGLNALAAPFKPLTRSWGRGGQDLADGDRKRELLLLAERAITRGAGSSWVSAVHCELCRPMLTVGAAAVLEALQVGVATAATPSAAEPLLSELLLIAQLAALLRLDDVRDRAVGMLADACNLSNPGPLGSVQEAKQLAALKKLLSLVAPPTVHSLGSAWVVLFRTISTLNTLTADLLQPLEDQPAPAPAQTTTVNASPFNKMFQAWGISLGGSQPAAQQRPGSAGPAGQPAAANGAGGSQGSNTNLHYIRQGPGASIVAWALADGKPSLEQIFTVSAALDGEAVLLYFGAMCAVSSEELSQPKRRMAFLQRMVHCAHANADRIRLIWAKLWALISANLVAAACHSSQSVALYSVEALRGLAVRLLSRAELAHFRVQEESLQPFVQVLRQSDDAAIRDATVAQLAEAVTAQPLKLGSGWKTLLEALAWAGADSNPSVVGHAAQALALPVNALYSAPPPAGHGYFAECVRAAVNAAQNRAASQQTGVAGVYVLQACAAQLSAYMSQGAGGTGGEKTEQDGDAGEGARSLQSWASSDLNGRLDTWALLLSSLADIIQQQDDRPLVANAAAQTAITLLQDYNALWSEQAWQTLLTRIVPALFNAAPRGADGAPAAPAGNGVRARDVPAPRPEWVGRAQQFFPLLCGQVQSGKTKHHHELMEELAKMALLWLQQTHEPLIQVGLTGYNQLLKQLIESGDHKAVHGLMDLLRPVLKAQLLSVMAGTHLVFRRGLGPSGQWPVYVSAPSQMLLAAHRSLAQLHTDYWQRMPWPLQAKLLEPLAACTRQCMLFNQALELEAEAAAQGAAAGTAAHSRNHKGGSHHDGPVGPGEGQGGAGRTGHAGKAGQGQVSGGDSTTETRGASDLDEVTADHILEAASASPRAAAPQAAAESDGSHARAAAGADKHRRPHQHHHHHKHANGLYADTSLLRLEMESARGVIETLELCIQEASNSGEKQHTAEPVKGTADNDCPASPIVMLHGLCEDIIKQGAAALTRSLQDRLGSGVTSILPDSAAQEPVPAWLSDAHAPLLARAVLVMATTPGAQQVQFVRSLFPHLLVVMCSHQPMVREAVAVYFGQAIRPLVMK